LHLVLFMSESLSRKPHRRAPVLMRAACLVTLSALLSACAIGPTYLAPQVKAPSTWHATLPHQGQASSLQDWWAHFDDPTVQKLIAAAEADSPTLDTAWANIQKARATLDTNRAAGMPSLTAGASATRARTQTGTVAATSNTRAGTLDASWELDLFGKVHRNTAAAQARIEGRQADWHDARVSLAAEVADTYVQYRGCRLLVDAYTRTAASTAQTAKLTQASVLAGLSTLADGALADASAASSRMTLKAQQVECDILVTSLSALTGLDDAPLRTLIDASALPALPTPQGLSVPEVPANAVRQRPDLSALERELAAASEEIGAAQANRYPSLSLAGALSVSAASGSNATTWSFGPSLSLPLFDGGQRRAAVETAQQAYDIALASYRSGVRTAVKEVEQALLRLDASAQREEDARLAAQGYQQSLQATQRLWLAGSTSLLSLEETRRSAISAEVDLLNLQQARIQYWIALYKALGGGWQADQLAHPLTPATTSSASTTSP
jgi:multidrug efflux system outer membrane protein